MVDHGAFPNVILPTSAFPFTFGLSLSFYFSFSLLFCSIWAFSFFFSVLFSFAFFVSFLCFGSSGIECMLFASCTLASQLSLEPSTASCKSVASGAFGFHFIPWNKAGVVCVVQVQHTSLGTNPQKQPPLSMCSAILQSP